MEPSTGPKDAFLLELQRRQDKFAQRLAQLSLSNYSKEALDLKQMLDEQLSDTEELIELYRSQLAVPADPLHDLVELLLTANYVSCPEVRSQLAEVINDDHKAEALLNFWTVLNGNRGDQFQTVLQRAVEYVDLYRRGSHVLAPNSSASLKSLHEFVATSAEWLANKSRAQFTSRVLKPLVTAEAKVQFVETKQEPAEGKAQTHEVQPTESKAETAAFASESYPPKVEEAKRKSWADEEDDVPHEETKKDVASELREGDRLTHERGYNGRYNRRYSRGRFRGPREPYRGRY